MIDVEITFDPLKSERNLRLRGISFDKAPEFDFGSATFDQDTRKDYGEVERWPSGTWEIRFMHWFSGSETVQSV